MCRNYVISLTAWIKCVYQFSSGWFIRSVFVCVRVRGCVCVCVSVCVCGCVCVRIVVSAVDVTGAQSYRLKFALDVILFEFVDSDVLDLTYKCVHMYASCVSVDVNACVSLCW